MGIGAGGILDVLHGRSGVLESDFTAQDIDQHGLAAIDVDTFEQRRTDGRLGRLDGAVFALGAAGAHHGFAHTLHHRTHVGEIQVHMVVAGNDFIDAAGRFVKNVVGNPESFLHRSVGGHDFQQSLIGNEDQRIDGSLQFLDALQSLVHPHHAFEDERFGDDTHGQGALVTGNVGDDRRRAGPGAASHARGNKNHIGPFEGRCDLVTVFFGGGSPPGGVTTGAEPFGELGSDLHGLMRLGILESLKIGIDGKELDAGEAGFDHTSDSVSAGSSDSRYLDISQTFDVFGVFKHHDTRLLLELGK